MRNYLKYQSPGLQFAVFLGLAAAMFLIYVFISNAYFGDVIRALTATEQEIPANVLDHFRWSQAISTLLTFVVPALLYGYLSDERPLPYLGLHRHTRVFIFLMVTFLLVVAQPFALYMGQLNQQVNFGSMQQELMRQEKMFENAMNNFVRMNSSTDLLINLLVVAVLPAIGEELFFRGALQNILERWTKVWWLSILFSSFVFAILHGTAFKFLGIFTLGLVLGTLFYVTRNLWYNIFFHFLNNSLALLTTYYASRSSMFKRIAEDDYKISLVAALTSLAVTIAIFLLIRKRNSFQPISPRPRNAHFDIE